MGEVTEAEVTLTVASLQFSACPADTVVTQFGALGCQHWRQGWLWKVVAPRSDAPMPGSKHSLCPSSDTGSQLQLLMLPVLQMGKLRHQAVRLHLQAYTAAVQSLSQARSLEPVVFTPPSCLWSPRVVHFSRTQ